MHLVSRVRQVVSPATDRFNFQPGEAIHVENSYKLDITTFGRLASAAGYRTLAAWTDADALFSVLVPQAA